MAEQVNIASLTIDVDDVIKESVRLKKELDGLKKTQKELKDSGEESSEAFVQNEIQLKKLSKAYRDNQSFATALDQANEDLIKTMSTENKSTQQLRDSRSQLNQISKNIIGDTEEEIELRDKLNKSIDDQTEALREQSSGFNASKDQVGEYEDNILSAAGKLGIFGGAIEKVRTFQEKFRDLKGSKIFKGQGEAAAGASKGVNIMTLSMKLLVAVPIVLLLTAIVGGFLLVKNAMNRNEEATTKIKKAFSAFTGIVKGLLKFLEPLGTFLIDGLVKAFELVEKGVFKALGAIQKGLEFLGLDKAAASLGNFTEEIEKSVQASKELTDAELELTKARRLARITELQFLKQAEELRQIRDDESKTIRERITANKELGEVLSKQLKEELRLAQTALEVANLRIRLDGETNEALDAQAEALTEIADIEERITGQTSEQLVNRVALQKDLAKLIEEEKVAEQARLQRIISNADTEIQIAKETKEAIIDIEKEGNETLFLETKKLTKKTEDISKAAAAAEVKLKNEVIQSNMDMNEQAFANAQQLLGESTKAGKAAGIATTLINTYQGAQAAFKDTTGGIFVRLLAAGAAVAAGLRNVAKIRATPTEFSKGDILSGRSHSRGGIPFSIGGKLGFEAEGGEAIINKKSTSMFAPLLSAMNVAGGGRKFASGGFAGTSSSISSGSLLDYDLLALRISEANASLPVPIVAVSEINEVNNNVAVVESLATA